MHCGDGCDVHRPFASSPASWVQVQWLSWVQSSEMWRHAWRPVNWRIRFTWKQALVLAPWSGARSWIAPCLGHANHISHLRTGMSAKNQQSLDNRGENHGWLPAAWGMETSQSQEQKCQEIVTGHPANHSQLDTANSQLCHDRSHVQFFHRVQDVVRCYAEDIRRLGSGQYGLINGRCSWRDAMSVEETRLDFGIVKWDRRT